MVEEKKEEGRMWVVFVCCSSCCGCSSSDDEEKEKKRRRRNAENQKSKHICNGCVWWNDRTGKILSGKLNILLAVDTV